jgi:predicted AlkP superfamily pyrophosphatase or phosphodiesterase
MRKTSGLCKSVGIPVLALMFLSSLSGAQQPATQSTPQPRRDAHVIMISIDGLIPDYYLQPSRLGLSMPNLTKMKLGGAYAEGVEGVFPSVTYPAHTTLISGVMPATHGVINNRIFEAPTEPQTGEWYWFSEALKSETLWSMAKKAGLVTANVGWPVTAGAEIDYTMPEIKDPSESPAGDRSRKRTLQYSTPGLVEKALAAGGSDRSTDGRRASVSEYIIANYKPNLMLIHFIELDGAHHENGPRSAAALPVAERMDAYVGRVIESTRKAGIFDQTTFFLVSDHGFAEVTRKYEPGVVLVKEKLITLGADGKPTDWKAAAWPAGGSCAIVLKDPNDKETAAQVTAIFTKIAKAEKSPINRVLNQSDLKNLGAIPNALLMIDAAPGYSFDEKLTGPESHEAKNYRGTHGQLPSRADMRSALIVFGQAARPGAKASIVRMIDIAPTAGAVLGLSFAEAEGLPMAGMLKPGMVPPQTKQKRRAKKNARETQPPR